MNTNGVYSRKAKTSGALRMQGVKPQRETRYTPEKRVPNQEPKSPARQNESKEWQTNENVPKARKSVRGPMATVPGIPAQRVLFPYAVADRPGQDQKDKFRDDRVS